ncbi:MAG: ATP-binding protein [archaeon]
MSDKNFIYVGGVPGAGKTTLCEVLSAKLSKIIHIRSGEIKRPEARRKYGIGLSKLDQEKSSEINRWFFNKLYTLSSSGIYLIDTCYTYFLEDGIFVNLCPEDIAKNLGLYILLETNPEEIVNRRIFRGRDRYSVSLDLSRLEIETERNEAIRLSQKFNTPLIILKNEGGLKSSFLNFQNFLKI